MPAVVLYRDRQGALRWGVVVGENRKKCEVLDSHYRRQHIPVHRILFTLSVGENEQPDVVLRKVQQEVEQRAEGLDLRLLWEIVQDEEREYSLRELAELYYGSEYEPWDEVALWLTLERDSVFFRSSGKGYRPRNRDQVEAIIHQQTQEKERETAIARLRSVFYRWLKEERISDEDADVVEQYLLWAQKRIDAETGQRIEKALNSFDTLRQNPLYFLNLLKHEGYIQDDLELELLHHGIEFEFDDDVKAFTDSITPVSIPVPERPGEWVFSIDDAETREVDDAIGIREDEEGRIVVTVYIADAALYVAKDTPLDRVAERRVATLYLPEKTLYMLPKRISTDLASLVEGEPRSSLAVRTIWDPAGNLIEWNFERTGVVIHDRFTYDDVNSILLDERGDGSRRKKLETILRLAENLELKRMQKGAVHLVRPEVKVRVFHDDSGNTVIKIHKIDTETPAHRLIREWMIFYNACVAEWAIDHDVAMIYRAQDPPDDLESFEPPGRSYDPVQFRRIVRKLKRSVLWPGPREHWALGLDAYIQMSSPLRRYTDLITQRQLVYYLDRGQELYDREILLRLMTGIEEKMMVLKEFERRRHRYWIIKHIKQMGLDAVYSATVIEERGGVFWVELDDFLLEASITGPFHGSVGDRVQVRPMQIDDEKLWVRVQVVEQNP